MATPALPPPIWLGILYFNCGTCGWSEKYYVNDPTAAGALTKLASIGELRREMLPTTVEVKYARISDMTKRGDAYIFTGFSNGGAGEIDETKSPCCVCLKLRYETDNGHHAIHFIHGIPRNAWTSTLAVAPATLFKTALDAYTLEVKSVCQMVITPFGGGPFEADAIDNIREDYFSCRKVGRPFGVCRGRIVSADLTP